MHYFSLLPIVWKKTTSQIKFFVFSVENGYLFETKIICEMFFEYGYGWPMTMYHCTHVSMMVVPQPRPYKYQTIANYLPRVSET